MTTLPFFFPSVFWITPVALVIGVGATMLSRNPIAGILAGMLGLPLGWAGYEYLLQTHMETWLEDQRVYAILFRDFPQDRAHFIEEFLTAYKAGGDIAVARKQEEMKIIMFEHHIAHYIENAPTDVLHGYINAETWFLSAITAKDKKVCDNYIQNAATFGDPWRAVGSNLFLAPLRYFPAIIVESVDHPETPTDADRAKAAQDLTGLVKKLAASGISLSPQNGMAVPCDTLYREFYQLSQMPPKDGALTLKLIMSEDHLTNVGGRAANLLKTFLPF